MHSQRSKGTDTSPREEAGDRHCMSEALEESRGTLSGEDSFLILLGIRCSLLQLQDQGLFWFNGASRVTVSIQWY